MSIEAKRNRRAIRRIAVCGALALIPLLAGCFEIVKYSAQHSLGARFGPCQRLKDSVERAEGKPYRRMFGDEEGGGVQLFTHEWGYRLPKDSSLMTVGADTATAVPDSVKVIAFHWGYGVNGCDVRERRVRALKHPSMPWEDAKDAPRLP